MTIPPDLEAQILRYYHVEKWRVGTIGNADQVVGDQIEHEIGSDLGYAAMFCFAHLGAMPSSRDIFKNIHRNSKGLINYYINSQIPFPANSNQYRFNNEFLGNQKL